MIVVVELVSKFLFFSFQQQSQSEEVKEEVEDIKASHEEDLQER